MYNKDFILKTGILNLSLGGPSVQYYNLPAGFLEGFSALSACTTGSSSPNKSGKALEPDLLLAVDPDRLLDLFLDFLDFFVIALVGYTYYVHYMPQGHVILHDFSKVVIFGSRHTLKQL